MHTHIEIKLDIDHSAILPFSKGFSPFVGVLIRLRKMMIHTQAKLQLYKSAILPNVTYYHSVWHFCKTSDAKKLERVQERAVRAVYDHNRTAEYEELLTQGKLPSLVNRRLQDMIYKYNVHNITRLILCTRLKIYLAPEHLQAIQDL